MRINPRGIPNHVAIIMDGNGRWARARHLPRIVGHGEGVKALERVVAACRDLGIGMLTVYAFSTENWKRSKREVGFLMGLFRREFNAMAPKLKKKGVKVNFLGDLDGVPAGIRRRALELERETADNDTVTLNVAFNYGSRDEITRAVRRVSADVRDGKIKADKIDDDMFSGYMYTAGMPDPDLLIRTSGEMRLSNFLLWQLSYSEIYVTPKLWPDFTGKDLEDAVLEFQSRKRRYGGR
ncbi:MAG: isoprenyl transferase [Candidatus Omnitrophota bacterium]